MSNAVKYNRDGGTVRLISEDVPDSMVRISVMDTGTGIAEEDQAGLFEPFNRLGMESSEIAGTGVGLTVTEQLVEAMNGHIGFESEAGEGSTFWVEFPVTEIAASNQAERIENLKESECPEHLSINATVLYIEDNPANLQLMGAIIASLDGVSMISAHNAELGISMAKEQQPDLILMDINLPGADGMAAMKTLGTIDATKYIPVIAISAAAMKDDVERGVASGFKAYLTKPFNVPKVIEAIDKELDA